MNETLKLSGLGMQRTNIELERQRHLANWLMNSRPHMPGGPAAATTTSAAAATTPTASATKGATTTTATTTNPGSTVGGAGAGPVGGNGVATAAAAGAPSNSVAAAAAAACNGGAAVGAHHGHHSAAGARKPKLRRFNSHDTSSNMFSVADFENARLARRNEIELNQRRARRVRGSANNSTYGLGSGSGLLGGAHSGYCDALNGSGDYSTGDSKASKGSSEGALTAIEFLERNSLPRVVRILHASKSSNETLQSSSSHGSSTAASSSSSTGANPFGSGGSGGGNISSGNIDTGTHSSSSGGSATGNGTGSGPGLSSGSGSGSGSGHQNNNGRHSSNGGTPPGHDELFLLYRLVRQRNIYHGHNAKTQASQRKKTLLIPQEFPGYFSMLSEKGLPTATQYGSLIQLVRERVYKFVSVDNMPAFTESSPNSTSSPTHEGCLPINKGRPQYVKTTARGGQVFRLLAVFEDGKQDQVNMSQHGNGNATRSHGSGYMGREKEKNRYAQLLNENRQVLYVPLSTKGKFYEIEPGIPQLLQKLGDAQRKLNPECVHRLSALVTAAKQLPLTLRYISGPGGPDIPEQLCISQVSKEDVVVGCSIEDVDTQTPLQLRKFYPSRDIQLVKSYLGFDSEQRMLANTNVQNMLKFCQFNCDPFLKLVEIELIQRSERSGSKNREGLRILKPLHFPKILRREKSSMAAAHEKEDSIIFLSKSDLENLEAKEAAASAAAHSESSLNRISERMRVFQSTKKKWFGKHHPQQQQPQIEKHQSDLDLDEQAKRMSMERYTDMSKLLQERFGSNPEQPEQDAISLNSTAASDTETTMLTTMEPRSLDTMMQKSMSLQDIELLNGQCKQRPDLLASHNHNDAISEAGTELEDVENQTPPPQSFITEKLYNEFHVKTRQYSKSSSSLHQLPLFSLPQKLQLHEAEKEKRHLMLLKAQQQALTKEPVTGRRAAGGVSLLGGGLNQLAISPASLVEDDLPYSSVRDSLVISGGDCLRSESASRPVPAVDYTKENIYAEICPSHTVDTFSGATQFTHVPDDDGDYASLKYSVNGPQSVSRIEVNGATAAVKSSAISYHTVYLGEEPLGERHAAHITTVELAGEDNIYNTLK
uniref:B4, isoform A n=1 Tax=Drosophila melanogaster TaxID=7227 RepID=Q9VJX3_DROME|eukprot:NP_001260445.1 B4, isoform C [Drosophila melanogaster]